MTTRGRTAAEWVARFTPAAPDFARLTCPRCRGFGWKMPEQQPVYDAAGGMHHPACPLVRAARGSARTGDILPCNLDDLVGYKKRLLNPWYQLRQDFDVCYTKLSGREISAFNGDFDYFLSWEKADLPFCDADAGIQEGRDLEARLDKWREIFRQRGCGLSSPDLPPLPDDDPRSRNHKPPPTMLSEIKGIAIVAAIGLGIVYLGPAIARRR